MEIISFRIQCISEIQNIALWTFKKDFLSQFLETDKPVNPRAYICHLHKLGITQSLKLRSSEQQKWKRACLVHSPSLLLLNQTYIEHKGIHIKPNILLHNDPSRKNYEFPMKYIFTCLFFSLWAWLFCHFWYGLLIILYLPNSMQVW